MISNNVVKTGGSIMINDDHFLVNFSLGNYCNYKCTYCWPGVNTGEYEFQDLKYYTGFIDRLKDQIVEGGRFKQLSILFTGGEPTTYKRMHELVKHFCDDKRVPSNVLFNSNMSAGKRWWKTIIDYGNDAGEMFVVASFHHEFANKKKFIDRCKFLKDNGVTVMVRKVVLPTWEHVNYCIDLFREFEEHGLYFEMKPELLPPINKINNNIGKAPHPDFTKEMLDRLYEIQQQSKFTHDAFLISTVTIDDQGIGTLFPSEQNYLYTNGQNFKDWDCWAGASHLAVGFNGDILRCFDVKGKDKLGNIYTNPDFKIYDGPKKCPVEWCSCITCLLAQKERKNV